MEASATASLLKTCGILIRFLRSTVYERSRISQAISSEVICRLVRPNQCFTFREAYFLVDNTASRPPYIKKRIKIGVNRLVFVLILRGVRGAKDERGRDDVWKNFMATE